MKGTIKDPSSFVLTNYSAKFSNEETNSVILYVENVIDVNRAQKFVECSNMNLILNLNCEVFILKNLQIETREQN